MGVTVREIEEELAELRSADEASLRTSSLTHIAWCRPSGSRTRAR